MLEVSDIPLKHQAPAFSGDRMVMVCAGLVNTWGGWGAESQHQAAEVGTAVTGFSMQSAVCREHFSSQGGPVP